MGLVLSRKEDETVLLHDMDTGDKIRVTVVEVRGQTVRLKIAAPSSWHISRENGRGEPHSDA